MKKWEEKCDTSEFRKFVLAWLCVQPNSQPSRNNEQYSTLNFKFLQSNTHCTNIGVIVNSFLFQEFVHHVLPQGILDQDSVSRVAAEIKASETTASASSEAPTAEASQSSSAAERLFSDLVPLDGEEGLGGGARRRPPERTKSASSSRKQRGSRMGLNLVRGINIPFIISSSCLVQTKSVELF